MHEAWFVRLKNNMLKLVVLQLLLVCFTYCVWHTSGRLLAWVARTKWYKAACKADTGVLSKSKHADTVAHVGGIFDSLSESGILHNC